MKSRAVKASGRANNCTNEEKAKILAWYDCDKSYRKVAQRAGRTESCVRTILIKYHNTGTLERAKVSGRRRCTSGTDDHKIIGDMKRNRGVTSKQILQENPLIKCSAATVRRRITEFRARSL